MKLYFHPASTTSRSVLLFCGDQGVTFEPVIVDLMTGKHHEEPFVSLNPSRQVPVLEDEGFVLTECSAILKYLAEKHGSSTYPKDLRQRAHVNELMDWFNTGFYREYGYNLIYPQIFSHHRRATDDVQRGVLSWGREKAEGWLEVLDKHWLKPGKRYLTGDHISIADYLGAALVSAGDFIGVDVGRFPTIDAWMKRMRALPCWSQVHEVHDGFVAALTGKRFETIR